MYSGRISQNVLLNQPNLKTLLWDNSVFSSKSYIMIRKLCISDTCSNLLHVTNRIKRIIKNAKLYKTLQYKWQFIPKSLKDQSSNVLRIWAHQCECVIAQRLRRSQQMFCLYTRLWEDHALKEFIARFKHQMTRKGKEFILGSVGVAAYNWDAKRIPDSVLQENQDALEYAYLLKEKTICDTCDTVKGKKSTSICECEKPNDLTEYKSYDGWIPFIEENDLIVWRRLHPSGQYEYKVYGSYHDVSAEDFLNVQIDIEYRKKWDSTAVILELVEKDPIPGSNNDIIYWEMLWPRIFANRDYVFHRKYMMDEKSKTLLIVSKATQHPEWPKFANKQRVEEYWSYMVIKPHTDIQKPGIEFVLTYFDNPGVNIPGSVTTWVAYRAMPDFLERLREASKKYQLYCKQQGTSSYCNFKDKGKHPQPKLPYCEDLVTDNTISEPQRNVKSGDDKEPKPRDCIPKGKGSISGTDLTPGEIMTSPSPMVQAESHFSYWKYFKPTYYFS